MSRPRLVFAWSTGKDSAFALHRLIQEGQYEVVGSITTVSAEFDRVAIHGVRNDLLDLQATALGLPVVKVPLPNPCTNEEYEAAFSEALTGFVAQGAACVGFGDLFLADIRAYREALLNRLGLSGVFPLWGLDTKGLAHAMIDSGLRAKVTCVSSTKLNRPFAGREFDRQFLGDLPVGIDPCGEHGEFHTFAYAGPMFSGMIPVRVSDVVERGDHVYADIISSHG